MATPPTDRDKLRAIGMQGSTLQGAVQCVRLLQLERSGVKECDLLVRNGCQNVVGRRQLQTVDLRRQLDFLHTLR